jgi:hypothetical protein
VTQPADGKGTPPQAPAQAPATAAPETKAPETPAAKKEGAAAEPAPASKEQPAAQPAIAKGDVKLPEGSLLAAETVEEIVSFVNEKKLPKDVAQAIVERESALLGSFVEGEKVKHEKLKDGWYEAAKGDKEFGGEQFDANIERGHRVIRRFFGPDFLKLLEATGGDVHPEVIRGFVRLGKQFSDDQLVVPGDKVPAEPSRLEDRLYKKEPQEKGE